MATQCNKLVGDIKIVGKHNPTNYFFPKKGFCKKTKRSEYICGRNCEITYSKKT